jgi:hypothetical protein
MRRALRRALKRRGHDRLDLLVGHRPRPSRPRLVEQSVKPPLGEPVAPLRDGRTRHPLALGDLAVDQTLRRSQHDPRAQRQRLRGLRPPRPGLQPVSFLVSQLDSNSSRNRHDQLLPQLQTI